VHILPFFPYSSDDGFSVIDYSAVDPNLGSWSHVERLGRTFRLMFDAVINHISAQSDWFQGFLAGNAEFADHFIVVDEGTDLSQVVRPRALPLLTRVEAARGDLLVWTTFSADQIDLNFASLEVLLKVVEVLLLYVEKGAQLIRLDAIAYLWKEIGTTCIHLDGAHRVVKLFRAVLDDVAPDVILITETNVPHEENISYFGDGSDEAQMVYQFPLPPLVLHAFLAGDASRLSSWADGLSVPSNACAFFNFLASHDGVGVRPVEGILSPAEVAELVDRMLRHGGHVSRKTNADGTESVYELNISYFDALSDPGSSEPIQTQVDRFLASQAIMLSLAGVPGIYFHSLFGSRNDYDGVKRTGRYRSINREKLERSELEAALAEPQSLRRQVFKRYRHLIAVRTAHEAFHPNGAQRVLSTNPRLFALVRTAPGGKESVLCIHNVSGAHQKLPIDPVQIGLADRTSMTDLIDGTTLVVDGNSRMMLELNPYQVAWLRY
jgi:sucrose phosphorylase